MNNTIFSMVACIFSILLVITYILFLNYSAAKKKIKELNHELEWTKTIRNFHFSNGVSVYDIKLADQLPVLIYNILFNSNINNLNDLSIQPKEKIERFFRHIDQNTISLALRNTDIEFRKKIYAALPIRWSEALEESLSYLPNKIHSENEIDELDKKNDLIVQNKLNELKQLPNN